MLYVKKRYDEAAHRLDEKYFEGGVFQAEAFGADVDAGDEDIVEYARWQGNFADAANGMHASEWT